MRAIEWTGNLAGSFPWLRPESTGVLRFSEEVADELGSNDGEVPLERIAEGVALFGPDERRCLVSGFAGRHPDEWAAVGSDAGDVPALERSLVAGAVRVAILERRLPPLLRLDHLERGIAPAHSAREILAVTLQPEAVWSVIDRQEAAQAAERADTERDWLRAILAVGVARLHEVHAARVRTLAAALRRRLPAPRFPAASALLDDACACAERDLAFAEEVALALLSVSVANRAAYVTSTN
jgi:hypothetical protein